MTGSIEGANAIATGDLIRLSEQELVDCDTYDYGCDGGNMDTAYRWIIKNGGIDSEADYPYTSANGRDGKCDKTKVLLTVKFHPFHLCNIYEFFTKIVRVGLFVN